MCPLSVQVATDPLADMMVTLLGPPGVGKTWMAATASAGFPAVVPCRPPVVLKDMLWILFDRGGLNGLIEQGVQVPSVNLSNLSGQELIDGVQELPSLIKKAAKDGAKYIVADTVTAFDIALLTHLAKTYSKWDLYGAALVQHKRVFDSLRGTGLVGIFLFHEKYLMPVDDDAKSSKGVQAADNARLGAAAKGLELGRITLDITGRAINLYRGPSRLILPVYAKRGAGVAVDRYVRPHDHERDSKTTYACLGDKEPANLHAIFEKIRTSSAV